MKQHMHTHRYTLKELEKRGTRFPLKKDEALVKVQQSPLAAKHEDLSLLFFCFAHEKMAV